MANAEFKRLKEIISILDKSKLKDGLSPEKVCDTLEKLGPTFIKIGQILSTRVDIIPKAYTDALANLRSNVTPISFNEIKTILNKEYKDLNKVFLKIDETPVGCASIAQVYKAQLLNGKEVIIKVKKESFASDMVTDINLMKKAVKMLHVDDFIKAINVSDMLDEMLLVTEEELDFTKEMDHIILFEKNNKDVSYVFCPFVYTKYSNANVIVMTYIDGVKIDDIKSLIKQGYNLEDISLKLSCNYIKQALDDGFFHADPHPDNIIISNGKIAFIDFGMMGTLTDKNKNLLKDCIKAMIKSDYYNVSEILLKMSVKNGDVDTVKLRYDIENILSNFGNTDLKNIDTSVFISNMFKMLKSNNLTLDKDVTMLIRGIGVIEPVLKKLNPDLSLFEVLSNKIDQDFIPDLKNDILDTGKKIIKSSKSVADLPNEALMFVRSLNHGETKFKFELSDSSKQVDKIEKLLHELIIGIIDASLILGASFVKEKYLRNIFVIFIIILSLWLFIKMFNDHQHRGY